MKITEFNVVDNVVRSLNDITDDIYMDGDYDYVIYDNDSDYADGVDDAMEESSEVGNRY